MLLQIKNKKGISIMIGYILLVSIAVIIGIFVYTWAKTYVPTDTLECPEDVSLYIESALCKIDVTQFGKYNLTLNLKNNGMFNLGGYYIHVTKSPDEELATLDLSQNLTNSPEGGVKSFNSVLFASGNDNGFEVNGEMTSTFEFDHLIYSIEIIPIRFQEHENKIKFVSCGEDKVGEEITCGESGQEEEDNN